MNRVAFVRLGDPSGTSDMIRRDKTRDLVGLVQHGLLEPFGKGRGARYVLKTTPE